MALKLDHHVFDSSLEIAENENNFDKYRISYFTIQRTQKSGSEKPIELEIARRIMDDLREYDAGDQQRFLEGWGPKAEKEYFLQVNIQWCLEVDPEQLEEILRNRISYQTPSTAEDHLEVSQG